MSQRRTPGELTIGSTEEISVHPARLARVRRSGRRPSLAALGRRCRAYFDWHPVTGGFSLAVAVAIVLTGGVAVFGRAFPVLNGWAICTPQNGAVLAVLLMCRRKLWPWAVLGYVVALYALESAVGGTPRMGAWEIGANVLEVLVAAFTLPPFRNFKQWLQEPRLLSAFAGYAMVLGPAALTILIARSLPGTPGSVADIYSGFWQRAASVGFAEALGVAIGSGFVLVLFNRDTYALFRWPALVETVGLMGLCAVATWFASGEPSGPLLLLLTPFVLLVVIGFRLGVRGAVLGTALVAATAGAADVLAFGTRDAVGRMSLIHTGYSDRVALTQGYLALAVLVVFPLSVTLFSKKYLEERLRQTQAEMDKLKSLDRLTGVANRRRFDLVLEREWQRALRDPKPVALLMVDVDDFDLYTQHYGPQASDECLRIIAAKMADRPHRAYDLVSRYGGGKFSVLLPGASGDAVERIAEEFRAEIAALELPFEMSPFERVTVSVGWAAMVPGERLLPEVLMAAAEHALHSARVEGGNRVEAAGSNVREMTAAR